MQSHGARLRDGSGWHAPSLHWWCIIFSSWWYQNPGYSVKRFCSNRMSPLSFISATRELRQGIDGCRHRPWSEKKMTTCGRPSSSVAAIVGSFTIVVHSLYHWSSPYRRSFSSDVVLGVTEDTRQKIRDLLLFVLANQIQKSQIMDLWYVAWYWTEIVILPTGCLLVSEIDGPLFL